MRSPQLQSPSSPVTTASVPVSAPDAPERWKRGDMSAQGHAPWPSNAGRMAESGVKPPTLQGGFAAGPERPTSRLEGGDVLECCGLTQLSVGLVGLPRWHMKKRATVIVSLVLLAGCLATAPRQRGFLATAC